MTRCFHRFRTVALLLALVVLPVSAQSFSIEQLLAGFEKVQVFRGQFDLSRKWPAFSKPFVSSGQFVSVRDRGLIWETLSPVASALIMTPGQVEQRTGDRTQTYQATGTAYDGMAILLPALLDGNQEQLLQYFAVALNGSEQNWNMNLEPASSELKGLVHTIAISGQGNRVSQIVFNGPSESVTHIAIHSLVISYDQPQAKDIAFFE